MSLPPLALVPTAAAFDELLRSDRPVLVSFTGPQCMICRRLHPMLETVVRETGSALVAVKLDVEALPAVSERFDVRSLPTTLLFRDGAVVDRRAGFVTAAQLRAWLAAHRVAAA